MDSNPRKQKKRRIKKPKTFKQKLKALLKSHYGVNNWEVVIFVSLLIVFFILMISFGAMNLANFRSAPSKKITNVAPKVANVAP